MGNTEQSGLEASIGFSRKWDAREAGREVARSALKKLKTPPSFFLLFSTIHYKDHGGFEELLKGVWDVLPKGTPLIGGTISLFINNHGCFSRGVTSLSVASPNIDVTIGIGKHTRINPKKAASNCAKMIKKGLSNSIFKNKFLIDMISAPTIPFGKVNVVNSKVLAEFVTYLGYRIFPILGAGVGRESEVVSCLSEYLPEYSILGGSAVDEGKMFMNFQFFGNQVHTNSIVAIGCSTNISISLQGSIVLHETGKKFEITSTTYHNMIIRKINNEPAKDQFFKLLDLPAEQFKELDRFYYKTADYFPITFEENNDVVIGICGILGNNLPVSHTIGGKKAKILTIDGKELTEKTKELIQYFRADSLPFIFSVSSAIYPYMLGRKTFDIKHLLDNQLGNKPYLFIYPMVENIRRFGEKSSTRVYSTNLFSLGQADMEDFNK